ncbi:MAG: TetR/AcrR family transcriptional regulator [Egibacteraceae bacterium]
MLNVSIATPASPSDRTGRARIRDAAIACFAANGVAGTSLKTIAAAAGLSPALVVHHFGSKDGLRKACDQYVAATIRERKRAAMAEGAQLDPLAAMRQHAEGPPLLRYLARTLTDGSPEVVALLDELVDDAVGYMEEGVRSGLLKPSDQPRERAVVLTMWSLGALTLHEHINRLLDVDITTDAEGMAAYFLPAAEALGRGVLADGVYEQIRDALTHTHTET